MTLTITDDRAAWDKLGLTLKSLDGAAVFAGLVDEALADRGYRHEVGEGVAERPWLGPSADEATPRAISTAQRELGAALDGAQTQDEALEEVGGVFESAARAYVRNGRVRGKALSDAAKRRDHRKLVNTGAMTGDELKTIVARSIDGEDS